MKNKKHAKVYYAIVSLGFLAFGVPIWFDIAEWLVASFYWRDHELFYPANISLINSIFEQQQQQAPKINASTCKVYRNSRQKKRSRDGYPKLVELFRNETIDFECVNARSRARNSKRIVLWNDVLRESDIFKFSSSGGRRRFRCPVSRCRVSDRRASQLERSDLVLVNLNDYKNLDLIDKESVVFSHNPPSIWTYILYKPLLYYNNRVNFDRFDWSISYESTSPFVPYDYREANIKWRQQQQRPREEITLADFNKKLNAVAAIIDENCSNAELLRQLSRYIRVDVFGNCGRITCENTSECLSRIARQYKFYFVVDSFTCSNYVSHKFFEILAYEIVPVIVARFDHDEYVPASAYVDASSRQFGGGDLNKLASSLRRIGSDLNAYKKYFEWKKYVRIEKKGRVSFNFGADPSPIESILCDLCIALHLKDLEPSNHHRFKSTSNRSASIQPNASCFRFRFFDILTFNSNKSMDYY